MANNDIYAEISEQQNQNLLDTNLISVTGLNSNELGKLANEARQMIVENDKIYKTIDNAETTEPIDKSEYNAVVEKGKKLIEETQQEIVSYEASIIYLNKMKELEQKYKVEKNSLADSVDGIVSTIQTNNRRVDYQTPEVNRVNMLRSILIVVFYVILIIYVLKNNFIQQIMNRNYRFVVFIIGCAFLPFVVDTLIAYVFLFIHYVSLFLSNNVPRDVYMNI